jgi:hypothetical protein
MTSSTTTLSIMTLGVTIKFAHRNDLHLNNTQNNNRYLTHSITTLSITIFYLNTFSITIKM